MGRAKKKGAPSTGEFSLFDESDGSDSESEEDLPRDEAGRAKIKHQYVDLLGIRVQKLAGRILNRERINKTLEGIYFVCFRCKKVCHNLDEGLVEDEANVTNTCTPCAKSGSEGTKVARKSPAAKPSAPRPESPPRPVPGRSETLKAASPKAAKPASPAKKHS